mgnify:CR=1 FL=1
MGTINSTTIVDSMRVTGTIYLANPAAGPMGAPGGQGGTGTTGATGLAGEAGTTPPVISASSNFGLSSSNAPDVIHGHLIVVYNTSSSSINVAYIRIGESTPTNASIPGYQHRVFIVYNPSGSTPYFVPTS